MEKYFANPSWDDASGNVYPGGSWRVYEITPSPAPRRPGATGRRAVSRAMTEAEARQEATELNRIAAEDARRADAKANAYEHGFDDEELGR